MDKGRKKTVVYGSIRQKKDLEYVFQELEFVLQTEDEEKLIQCIKEGYFAVLCSDDKSNIISLMKQENVPEEKYMTDQELINTLNFPLMEYVRNRRIVIWGTSNTCNEFENVLRSKEINIQLYGYVDNDKCKVGTSRMSVFGDELPVMSPDMINPTEYYVIIATSYRNYVSIERDLSRLTFKKQDYVYYRTVIDDVAEYFSKVYKMKLYYNTECKNKDCSVRIKSNGDVCTCCMAYESVYGNLYEHSFEEIWQSKRAAISRLALENKTYVYCDAKRCHYLSNIKPKLMNDEYAETLRYRQWTEEYPSSIAPEVDRSCNLCCTSCRSRVFVENSMDIEAYADMILDKVVSLPTRLILNTVGEVFASKYCLKILNDEKTRNRESISLYSNGTLLSPDKLDALLKEYQTLEVAISIDAASEETYHKIRRNGDFKVLCENLEYMSVQKKLGRITFFQINYVIQAENIAEISQFVQWGRRLGVDRIVMHAIENWGVYSSQEFEEVSVFRNGKIKEEFLKYFTKDIIEDEIVDLGDCANYLGVVPKLMYIV